MHFEKITPILRTFNENFLNLGVETFFYCYNLRLVLKILRTSAILAQFTVKFCAAGYSRNKFTKPPYFGV